MNQSLGKWLLRCGIACLFVPYALPLLAYAWSDSLAISMPLMDWLASVGLLLVGAVLCASLGHPARSSGGRHRARRD